MKKIIVILAAVLMVSCKKKEEVKPANHLVIECYSKSGNATLNFKGEAIPTSGNTLTKEYDINDNENAFTITLKNNDKLQNDSISLKVTYLGKTKQKGAKSNGLVQNLIYQLSEFE